jgi:hypothetical protein
MSTAKFYRDKAVLHLEQAHSAGSNALSAEAIRLALSYLRLADLAEKNGTNDIVYETPVVNERR